MLQVTCPLCDVIFSNDEKHWVKSQPNKAQSLLSSCSLRKLSFILQLFNKFDVKEN